MKQTNFTYKSLLIMFVVVVVAGCAAVRPFPMAARPGETILLAVGSPDGMTTANTTATYTPSGGSPVPLIVRSVFKLYPDNTSPAWLDSSANVVERDTGHGPWTTILAADLPLTLTAGTGDIEVTTPAIFPPPPARDINDALIPMEILSGTGISDPFTYEIVANLGLTGDLSQLEPERRIVVKPVYTGEPTTTYGAIEVRVDVGFALTDYSVVVDPKIKNDLTDNRLNHIWGQIGTEIVASFISPTGALDYSQVYFSIVSDSLVILIDNSLVDVNTLTPVVTYYDVDGNVVSGADTFEISDET